MRANAARQASLSEGKIPGDSENLIMSITQSLLWSTIDSSYDGLAAFFISLLSVDTEESRKMLLTTIGILFSCPDVKLIEQQILQILSILQDKISDNTLSGILDNSDFWILLTYFGLHSTSSRVRRVYLSFPGYV
jgi:hypothetical protein